jgi:large subunit ribosomal protein L40
MVEACDELERMTSEGGYPRAVYERAMARPAQSAGGEDRGRKVSQESKFKEARMEGLVPREAWVPTETRGKAWNYGWKRPGSD